MKRVLIILFVFAMVGSVSAEELVCVDNDVNLDSYFVQSHISISNQIKEIMNASDFCLTYLSDLAGDSEIFYQNMIKGMVDDGVITRDQENNEDILIETYCPLEISLEDIWLPFKFQKSYECLDGCEDGACKDSPPLDTGDDSQDDSVKSSNVLYYVCCRWLNYFSFSFNNYLLFD